MPKATWPVNRERGLSITQQRQAWMYEDKALDVAWEAAKRQREANRQADAAFGWDQCCRGCHSEGGIGTCPDWCESQFDRTHHVGGSDCTMARSYG